MVKIFKETRRHANGFFVIQGEEAPLDIEYFPLV